MAAYYGLQISWDDTLEDGSDETYADTALSNAESMLCQVYGIEGYAKANKVELTDADKETIKTQLESDIKRRLRRRRHGGAVQREDSRDLSAP